MTVSVDANQVRQDQQGEWTAAAPGWTRYVDEIRRPAQPITARLIEYTGIRRGQHVLDLACGVGDPALSIARLVGPEGSVLGVDVTTAMVEGARAHAEAEELTNARFRTIDSELEPGVPDAAFDAVTCRHGLMYMPDPSAAVAAWVKALKPGGRLAVSSWGSPDQVPFFTTALGILARHIELPPPDPSAPGPFALPSTERLRDVLQSAGMVDVETAAFDTPVYEAESAAEWWDLLSATGGPLVMLLASLPPSKREEIREDAIKTATELFPAGPVSLGGRALVAGGVKPA